MKIYILSRGENIYSTKSIFEAGVKRGHEMQVIDYMSCNIIIEGDKPSILYKGSLLPKPDAIIPRIGASRTFFGSAVVRHFEMMKVFSTVKSQSLVRSRDKLRSMQILSGEDIPVPMTVFCSTPDEVKKLIKFVKGPPIIIKLLEGTQGKGVVLAETTNAAKSTLDAFYGLKANILIQEFIKEAGGKDIRIFIVNGKVVGSMIREGSNGEFRSNLHQGGVGKKFKPSTREKEVALKAAKALGLGVAGVDLILSDRGALVMEVNSSPGLEGIELATKKDIASEIIKYIEQEQIKKEQKKNKSILPKETE